MKAVNKTNGNIYRIQQDTMVNGLVIVIGQKNTLRRL